MEREIEETIKVICKRIREMSEPENFTEISAISDMVKALAELISARNGLF